MTLITIFIWFLDSELFRNFIMSTSRGRKILALITANNEINANKPTDVSVQGWYFFTFDCLFQYFCEQT